MSKKELTLKQLARWFYNYEPRNGDHFESKWNHFLAQEPYWKEFMETTKDKFDENEINFECPECNAWITFEGKIWRVENQILLTKCPMCQKQIRLRFKIKDIKITIDKKIKL